MALLSSGTLCIWKVLGGILVNTVIVNNLLNQGNQYFKNWFINRPVMFIYSQYSVHVIVHIEFAMKKQTTLPVQAYFTL